MIACVLNIEPLLANQRGRGGWKHHHATEQAIKDLAWADARQRRGRHERIHGPVVVTLVVTPPSTDALGRRRAASSYPDLDGYQPTLKRMLDGVVLAGTIRNDSPDVVTEVRIRQADPGPSWRLELHLDGNSGVGVPSPADQCPKTCNSKHVIKQTASKSKQRPTKGSK